jgi:hypothetical protein
MWTPSPCLSRSLDPGRVVGREPGLPSVRAAQCLWKADPSRGGRELPPPTSLQSFVNSPVHLRGPVLVPQDFPAILGLSHGEPDCSSFSLLSLPCPSARLKGCSERAPRFIYEHEEHTRLINLFHSNGIES